MCAWIIAANCGADVYLISSRGFDVEQEFAEENNGKFHVNMKGGDGSTEESLNKMIKSAE